MRIAIDARAIAGARTGKGEYSYQIIKHLAKIDSRNQYFLYSREKFPCRFGANFKIRRVRLPGILWHLFVWLDLELILKPDVYLALVSYILPALGVKNSVVFTPDLVTFLFPQKHNPKAVFLERCFLKRALAKSERVIAISNATKRDLRRLFSLPSSKINVVYLAADQYQQKSPSFLAEVRQKYNLPSEFILFAGTLEPRKNLIRLLEAYQRFPLKEEYGLVIAGKKGWYYEGIFQRVRQLNLERYVHFLGYIERKDLIALYHLAAVFVFPSLYEGFGLPPLEAMACGAPVITSNLSSLPEVAGGAALLVNPRNVAEIAEALERILTNQELRVRLARLGRERVKKFSWEQTAREILKILERI
ncbi:MAG: glycosyltransferase family 1 protein [Patescibacteria group bacterium]|nr:glycosyltransferase family 1 protein [Patescibacteria group bacterium]